MPVVHPVCQVQDTLEAAILVQDRTSYFANELIAMVESVQLLYESGILNIPDQGHGAYS